MYFIFDIFEFFHRCSGKGCWEWPWLSTQRLVSVWDLTSSSGCSRIFSETFIRLVGALRLHQNSAVLSKPAYETLKSYVYLKYYSVLSETETTFRVLSSPQHISGWVERVEKKENMFIFSCMWLRGTAGEIKDTPEERNRESCLLNLIIKSKQANFSPRKGGVRKRRIKKKSNEQLVSIHWGRRGWLQERVWGDVVAVSARMRGEGAAKIHCGYHTQGILLPWHLILKWKLPKILETNAE